MNDTNDPNVEAEDEPVKGKSNKNTKGSSFRRTKKTGWEEQTNFGFYDDDEETRKQAREELGKIQTKTFDSLDDKFPEEVVPGLLYKGRRMIVSGKPIVGKGLLLIQLACCVATGEEFLGHPIPRPMKVFIADFELMEAQLKQRIGGFIKARAKNDPEREKRLRILIRENLQMACYLRQRHWLHHPEVFDDIIRRAYNESHRSELVILDPGWRLRKSEMIEEDIRKFLWGVDRIESKTGASIVYAQHQTKGPQENKAVAERSSGRYDFVRDAATILVMTSNEENQDDGLFKVETRTNDFAQPDPFHIFREYPVFRRVSLQEMKDLSKSDRQPDMRDYLRTLPPSISDLNGSGEQEILTEKHDLTLAKTTRPHIGEKKARAFKASALEDKLIQIRIDLEPGKRGAGKQYISKTKNGIHYEVRNI